MIQLDVTPQTEDRLRRIAQRLGNPISDYLVDLIEEHVSAVEETATTETDLMQQINLGLPEDTWREYFSLLRKQDEQTLDPGEYERVAEIASFLEVANAKRIRALIQLAELRETTLDALMDEFGIKPIDYQNAAT